MEIVLNRQSMALIEFICNLRMFYNTESKSIVHDYVRLTITSDSRLRVSVESAKVNGSVLITPESIKNVDSVGVSDFVVLTKSLKNILSTIRFTSLLRKNNGELFSLVFENETTLTIKNNTESFSPQSIKLWEPIWGDWKHNVIAGTTLVEYESTELYPMTLDMEQFGCIYNAINLYSIMVGGSDSDLYKVMFYRMSNHYSGEKEEVVVRFPFCPTLFCQLK